MSALVQVAMGTQKAMKKWLELRGDVGIGPAQPRWIRSTELLPYHTLTMYGGRNRKTWYMVPFIDYDLNLCRLQHIYHGQPYVRVDHNPVPEFDFIPQSETQDLASVLKSSRAKLRVNSVLDFSMTRPAYICLTFFKNVQVTKNFQSCEKCFDFKHAYILTCI